MYDVATCQWWHFSAWVAVVLGGLELLSFLVNHLDSVFRGRISAGGKPLETLSAKDKLFIGFNKCTTPIFTYHVLLVAWQSKHVEWDFKNITIFNTVLSMAAFYIIYDFFYTLFHRALHLRSIYWIIHKHHHRQIVPFRGNLDAVNVHPFEFIVGEYIHLLVIYLVPCHIVAVAAFIILGGVLASLNHTRLDVCVDGIYQVRFHDLHHRIPTVNYGQYIMLWDKAFGSFQPYSKADATSSKGTQ
jgi:sterol desaturase/sphingolipid hydroxylase (fatty acid hydroxylase superfamily)